MCGIVGALFHHGALREDVTRLRLLYRESEERGRDDGKLYVVGLHGELETTSPFSTSSDLEWVHSAIGNLRGEPTTEWVREKSLEDQQPFISPNGRWIVTHNGTIANDAEIHDTTCPPGQSWPTRIDTYAIAVALETWGFREALDRLQGSYAFLAVNRDEPDRIYWATNYKPLFVLGGGHGTFYLASQVKYLSAIGEDPLRNPSPVELGPYEAGVLSFNGMQERWSLYPPKNTKPKTLVVCSGGLDSGTVAWHYHRQGHDVTLLHLQYGCKAEEDEVSAVTALATVMQVPVMWLETDFFSTVATSVLTDPSGVVNRDRGGEAGAELAHEWVPARNTVMMSLALAVAEKHGYDNIALGSNMEEGGAYPDNEQEFINKLRALVPYAVAPYRNIQLLDPLGTLVKHEIVELGSEEGMPFELTWSCYEGESLPVETPSGAFTDISPTGPVRIVHCGTCGPCAMRRRAFQMAGVEDPTEYAA